MPYDNKLDEQVFSKSADTETGKIVVSVYSYNKGVRKLQITREVRDRENNLIFAKLGRLAKDEIENILPIIQEAIKNM